MKNIRSIAAILLVCVVFLSCKKKKEEAAPTTPTPSVPSGQISNIIFNQNYYDISATVTRDSSVFAIFYEGPFPTSSAVNGVDAGTVTVNGTQLTNSSNYYYNPSPINISGVIDFSVTGSGTLSAFNYSYTANYPKYTGGNLLPDSCTKSSGVTINISGITNSGSYTGVSIQQGSAYVHKELAPGPGSLSFSTSELSAFNIGNSITITVSTANYKTYNVGTLTHYFGNQLNYYKFSYLK